MNDFVLSVGGIEYAGWTSLSITRAIDQLAHSFGVSFTDKWTKQEESIPIKAGKECKIVYDGTAVITGYIDEDTISYNGDSRTLSFSGRSKTCDLVDCTPSRSNKRAWRGAGLLKIAGDLCSPFGINVTATVNLGSVFKTFSVEEGETVFSALEKLSRMRGVLMMTNNNGDLVFDRAGTRSVSTKLVWGDNILSGQGRRSWRDRFSEYNLIAQTTGDDNVFGKSASIRRTVTDPGIDRHRPMTITADTEDSGSELKKRADWELNVRAGRSRSLTYVVSGWEHNDGLWEPNTLVRVEDDEQDLHDWLLISSVTATRNEQGTTTELSLISPSAFDVEPLSVSETIKESGALL